LEKTQVEIHKFRISEISHLRSPGEVLIISTETGINKHLEILDLVLTRIQIHQQRCNTQTTIIRRAIEMVNYYHDRWLERPHLLAPLFSITSAEVKMDNNRPSKPLTP
jgi:hypothetical protein